MKQPITSRRLHNNFLKIKDTFFFDIIQRNYWEHLYIMLHCETYSIITSKSRCPINLFKL